MLPKEQYARANGMMSLVETAPGIFAPLMAGALIGAIGLTGVLIIDIVTFIFAIGALLVVFIPNTPVTEEGQKGQGSLFKEAGYGFWYILKRPSLLGLQIVFLIGNFFVSIPGAIYAALILARSGNNELVFGAVNTVGAVGGLIGGLAMSAWGGPKRRVHGVLAGWAISGLLGHHLDGFGKWAGDLGGCQFLGRISGPLYQWLEPGHLAVESRPRYPGAGFFDPAPDRLVCQPAGDADRRTAGRPGVRACHAIGHGFSGNPGEGGWKRSRFGYLRPLHFLRHPGLRWSGWGVPGARCPGC